jgi:hypothetical protein
MSLVDTLYARLDDGAPFWRYRNELQSTSACRLQVTLQAGSYFEISEGFPELFPSKSALGTRGFFSLWLRILLMVVLKMRRTVGVWRQTVLVLVLSFFRFCAM